METAKPCPSGQQGAAFDFPITMAFQLIVNVRSQRVFAHEALMRGGAGKGAASVLSRVSEQYRTPSINSAA